MSKQGYKNSPTGILDDQKGGVGVNRHYHDLSRMRATSLPIAKVAPILNIFLQGNSHVKMNPRYAVVTNPTVSPVFSPIDVTSVTVFCPLRLYSRGLYGNNFLEVDNIDDIAFAQMAGGHQKINDDTNGFACLYGSLLNRLGYPCFINNGNEVVYPLNRRNQFSYDWYEAEPNNDLPFFGLNALSVLAYFDSCRYFFADAYDKNLPFVTTYLKSNIDGDAWLYNRQEYFISYDELVSAIYDYRFAGNEAFCPLNPSLVGLPNLDFNFSDAFPFLLSSIQSDTYEQIYTLKMDNVCVADGLFPVTYKPDYFSAWYDAEETEKLAISTTGNVVSIRLAQAEFNKDASILVRGKRYGDYNEVLTGATLELKDHPIFCGSDRLRIAFDDRNSTAQSGDQPLGTPYGKGQAHNFKTKRIEFTTQEAGILLVLATAVPTVFHSDATNPIHKYLKFGDLPNRFFDGAGFQSLRAGEAVYTSSELDQMEVGTQPFYMESMVGYDVVDGLLATAGYRSYTFTRNYDISTLPQTVVGDIGFILDNNFGKYIRTSDYDYIFPAYAPIGVEGQSTTPYQDNIFLLVDFNLRVNQPLTNQVITTNSI